MKNRSWALWISFSIICLTITACTKQPIDISAQAPPAETALPVESTKQQPEKNPTTNPTATLTVAPIQSIQTKLIATPTVSSDWFDPINTMDESDYQYYDQLLLVKDDQFHGGSIFGASGLSVTKNDTCDLIVQRYVYADDDASAIRVTFWLMISRYSGNESAISAMQERRDKTLSKEAIIEEIPAGLTFPEDTTIFSAEDTIFVMSRYGSFLIFLMQDLPDDLTTEETKSLFVEMLNFQIQKLADAGY